MYRSTCPQSIFLQEKYKKVRKKVKLEKPTCKSCYLRPGIPVLSNHRIRQADQSKELNMLFYFLFNISIKKIFQEIKIPKIITAYCGCRKGMKVLC